LFLISTVLLLTAMNQSLINKIKQDRYFDHLNPQQNKSSLYHKIFIRSDRWRYGDLYGLCYLPQYKHKLEPFKTYHINDNQPIKNNVLYIIGDSFLADKTLDGAFINFNEVYFLDRRFPVPNIMLDTTKQNYLIMEFAERNLAEYLFTNPDQLKDIENESFKPVNIFTRINNIIFNKELSRNIELLLFDNTFFTPLKEAKAWLNYHFFGRLAKEVAVSTDKKRLFLNASVDTASAQSAFKKIADNQINTIVKQLYLSSQFYKSKGFKKVYLAIIPNAVSVYDVHRMPYNHLLQRIENQTNFPTISVYNKFKTSTRNLFYLSDAHWNPLGLDTWISITNKTIVHDTIIKSDSTAIKK
jgi:hypothetical protein